MRRQRFRKSNVNVSLFPFLAVLVCTMGVLIVLLVLVVQQARVHASVTSPPPDEPPESIDPEELETALGDLAWRREILEQQRAEMSQRLADRRLQLSHLEDHIRRLQAKLKQLAAEAEQLQAAGQSGAQDQDQAAAELARLQAAIELAEQELAAAREAAARQPRSFAIIPYEGPHGTRRRPIFVECTANGIVLQPEGVILRAADFDGPLDPGNPLAAALRATREYLARHGGQEESGEPYPLLIVRPDGSHAYNVARAAMKSWDDEFGYELIDADEQLAFPPANPELRRLLEQTVADARQRQQILAAAMPSRFPGGAGGGFIATSSGGFAPLGGLPSADSPYTPPNAHRAPHGGSPQRPPAAPTSAAEAAAGEDRREQAAGSRHPTAAGEQGGQVAQPTPGTASLAARRGGNWALPKATATATAVTRPLRVVCWSQRLLIMPDEGDPHPPRIIAIGDSLEASIDEFVSAIWEHTDRWGLAVAGGYWKPVLNVEVAPGGEARFAELQTLMQGSGLPLKRKSW